MNDVWEIFSEYLFLINLLYDIQIFSFVLMSNHFHLICLDPKLNLSKAMGLFMHRTSCEIGKLSKQSNRLWGRRYYSSIISNPLHYLHAYKYNYRNPVAAGICDRVEDYPWSTLQILLGQKPGIIPVQCDETLLASLEQTLAWLNESYSESDAKAINLGFAKREFKLPLESTTKRKHRLSSWESLPNFYASNCEKAAAASVTASVNT